MSEYYIARKTKNLYDPAGSYPFKLSRSKIDLFLNCPRCFYLDRRLGVSQPPGYPFNLNSAVDFLLKKEFDSYRQQSRPHPLQQQNNTDCIPYAHPMLDSWRENFTGISFLHKHTNFQVFGAIDDLWVDSKGELVIVDYKATAKDGEVGLDADWQIAYKRQMEVYQWLFGQNGFTVSSTGYFVYCNGLREAAAFNACLKFDIKLIAYTGNPSWVEPALLAAKKCLNGQLPEPAPTCDYCKYITAVGEVITGNKSLPISHIPEDKTIQPVKLKKAIKPTQDSKLF